MQLKKNKEESIFHRYSENNIHTSICYKLITEKSIINIWWHGQLEDSRNFIFF